MKTIQINPDDNVAVAIEPIAKGDRLEARGADLGVTAKSDITIYHKVAIRDIPKGEPVVKYGEHIGLAAEDIPAGTHVHTHNVENHREAL